MRARADSKEGKAARSRRVRAMLCHPGPGNAKDVAPDGPGGALRLAALVAAAGLVALQFLACVGQEIALPGVCTPAGWAASSGCVATAILILAPRLALVGTTPAPSIDAVRGSPRAMAVFHWSTRVVTGAIAACVAYLLSAHRRDIAAFHVVIRVGVLHSVLSAAYHLQAFVRLHVLLRLALWVGRCRGADAGRARVALAPTRGIEMAVLGPRSPCGGERV